MAFVFFLYLLSILGTSPAVTKEICKNGNAVFAPLDLVIPAAKTGDFPSPKDVQVEALSDTALSVTWQPPENITDGITSTSVTTDITSTAATTSTSLTTDITPTTEIVIPPVPYLHRLEQCNSVSDLEYVVEWRGPETYGNSNSNCCRYDITGLAPETTYSVVVAVVCGDEIGCSDAFEGATKSTATPTNLSLILGLAIPLAVVSLILIALAVYFGYKRFVINTPDEEEEMTPVIYNDEEILRKEFSSMFDDMDMKKSATIASSFPKKNRYKNILPYDHSLVGDIKGVEYINASYVLGKKFIATQDPLPDQVNDFWQLIWDCKVRVIVRVSNDSPDLPVAIYLNPASKHWVMGHDELSVTVTREDDFGTFYVTTLRVVKGKDQRTIRHYHMLNWGHDVMPSADELLEVVMAARKSRTELSPKAPILVHCGAGVGRTGTIIAIWQQIDTKEKKKLSETVQLMREDRVAMVQNVGQYLAVDRCLTEYKKNREDWERKTSRDTYEEV